VLLSGLSQPFRQISYVGALEILLTVLLREEPHAAENHQHRRGDQRPAETPLPSNATQFFAMGLTRALKFVLVRGGEFFGFLKRGPGDLNRPLRLLLQGTQQIPVDGRPGRIVRRIECRPGGAALRAVAYVGELIPMTLTCLLLADHP